jgi:Cu2+-containing amine oxidase
MVPLVDLNNGRVVHIDMYDVAPPVPSMRVNYHRDLQETPFREDIKELSVVQPQVGGGGGAGAGCRLP